MLSLKNTIHNCIVTRRKIFLPVSITLRDKQANLYCRIYLCIAKQFRNQKIEHKYISVDDIMYRLFCVEIVDVGRESNPSVTRRILIEEQRRTYDLRVEILRNDEAKYLGVI